MEANAVIAWFGPLLYISSWMQGCWYFKNVLGTHKAFVSILLESIADDALNKKRIKKQKQTSQRQQRHAYTDLGKKMSVSVCFLENWISRQYQAKVISFKRCIFSGSVSWLLGSFYGQKFKDSLFLCINVNWPRF